MKHHVLTGGKMVRATRRYASSTFFANSAGFIRQFPTTLPVEEIAATNYLGNDIHSTRPYNWNGWSFDVPAGVFLPGPTSRILHDQMLSGAICVTDRRYVAMGVGLGVEAVIAGSSGAQMVYAVDIDPKSVETTVRHYEQIVGPHGPDLLGIVSDLWDNCPSDIEADLVTFNPPFIDALGISDSDIRRNIGMGLPLAERFFLQTSRGNSLAKDGVLYMLLSNTTPLRQILQLALSAGYTIEVLLVREWERVLTFLFALRHS
jgi:release factor glutamine methyltransferase